MSSRLADSIVKYSGTRHALSKSIVTSSSYNFNEMTTQQKALDEEGIPLAAYSIANSWKRMS